MHIVLAVLTSIVTVLYLLDRMGVDLGGLNPWAWRRRRSWRNKFEGDPIFAVEDPREAAAILVVGAAKIDGDVSAEQKGAALAEFESQLSLSARDAAGLFTSASHLLAAPQLVESQLMNFLERQTKTFSDSQARSVIEMAERVASANGALSEAQSAFLAAMRSKLATDPPPKGTWA